MYESTDGFVIHIAGNRIVGDVPPLLDITKAAEGEWIAAYRKQSVFMDTALHENITLPFSGETFTEDSLEDLYARLVQLVDIGYHVPEHVFTEIQEELREPVERQ